MKRIDHASIAKAIVVFIKKERHFHDINISRDSVAKELGIGKTLFSEIMEEHFQMSFPDYLNKCRAEYARHLMLSKSNPNRSLEEIAFRSGFTNRITFYRAFIKNYGVSPRQFRKEL